MATCADEYDPAALSVEQARDRIRKSVSPMNLIERVALRDALDRIIAHDVEAPFDIPSAANAAMDGYALRAVDSKAPPAKLLLVGQSYAGKPFQGTLSEGQCARITTGALLPDGSDTIVMQEHVQKSGDRIIVPGPLPVGQHVRYAGEDLKAGTCALKKGKRLNAADIGLLASIGHAEADVVRRPIVAFFSTGDELQSIGKPLQPGQLYDSNRYTLNAMLKRTGAVAIDLGVVPDNYESIHSMLSEAAACADLVITSGGVSVGDADFTKDALTALGTIDFWKIAVKPGRPLAFGKIGTSSFLGLPGNPVSVIATFILFARPAIARLCGESETPEMLLPATSLNALRKTKGRTDYQRGLLSSSPETGLTVETTGLQGSHVLSSMSRANCFIVLPRESGDIEPGDVVNVMPFPGIL